MACHEQSLVVDHDMGVMAPARDGQRQSAMTADAASLDTVLLADVWKAVIHGEAEVVDHFSTDERHYLLLRTRSPRGDGRQVSLSKLDALEKLLLGTSQKAIAIEQDVTASTIAMSLHDTLRLLGIRGSASRAPLQLALLVHAHHGKSAIREGRVSRVDVEGQTLLVVSTRLLDTSVGARLSRAEREVVRFRAEGESHAEIASRRKSSRRTVANQLASAFRKMGVSSRLELVGYLSRGGAVTNG